MATIAQVMNFISIIAPIAQRQAAAHGNKTFTSVCIAQACCESAYGTSPKMILANAVFGIKVGASKWHFGTAWKDKAYSTATKECYDGKTYTNITDMFRAYDSIEDATEDYFDLLCTASRYKYALNRRTSRECIEGIQKAPYATSPTYVQTIMSIIESYNLTQYDPGADTHPAVGNPYPEPTKNVRLNSRGNDVRWLQYELNRIGGYKLVVDGIAGGLTIGALKDFQGSRDLIPDGICGSKTREKLKSI